MKIIQIAPSAGLKCGVGNFALNFDKSLSAQGVDVTTTRELLHEQSADIAIIQHGWALFNSDQEVIDYCSDSKIPVFVFSHYEGSEVFEDVVSGYLTLARGILPNRLSKPVHSFPHPAWVPDELEDRESLKKQFGLPGVPVVGTNGFLLNMKEYPETLSLLLPHAEKEGFFVDLVTSAWFKGSENVTTELDKLCERYPAHLRYSTCFLDHRELNLRLQACDLLWCWNAAPSSPYGSGSISDQYGSGTRLITPDKEQFSHVLGMDNTVTVDGGLDGIVRAIVNEVRKGEFPRHDPSALGWNRFSAAIVEFLRSVTTKL